MQYFDQLFGFPFSQLFQNLVIGLIAIAIGIIIKYILKRIFLLFSRYWATFVINSIIKHLNGPVGFFIPLLLLNASFAVMKIDLN